MMDSSLAVQGDLWAIVNNVVCLKILKFEYCSATFTLILLQWLDLELPLRGYTLLIGRIFSLLLDWMKPISVLHIIHNDCEYYRDG